MSAKKIDFAVKARVLKEIEANPDIPIKIICKKYGISVSVFYAYFPGNHRPVKVDSETKAAIREDWKNLTAKQIAEKYNISLSYVRHICPGKNSNASRIGFTKEQIAEINAPKGRVTIAEISKKYGITPATTARLLSDLPKRRPFYLHLNRLTPSKLAAMVSITNTKAIDILGDVYGDVIYSKDISLIQIEKLIKIFRTNITTMKEFLLSLQINNRLSGSSKMILELTPKKASEIFGSSIRVARWSLVELCGEPKYNIEHLKMTPEMLAYKWGIPTTVAEEFLWEYGKPWADKKLPRSAVIKQEQEKNLGLWEGL